MFLNPDSELFCHLYFQNQVTVFISFLKTCLFLFGCAGSWFLHPAFSSCDEQGLVVVALRGLLTVGVSLAVEHGSRECSVVAVQSFVAPQHVGSSQIRD